MTDPIDDVRRLIESRLAEIDAESHRLERAVASMGEGRRPRRRAGSFTGQPSNPKRRSPLKRKSAKRATRGQRRVELLTAIKATPGARPADLAKMIGIPSTQVHALIAKARAEKPIVKRGKGYALKGKP